MKKIIVLLILFGIISYGFSLKMEVNTPTQVGINSTISTQIKLIGNADRADIGIILPKGWKLLSWSVYGIPKESVYLKYENLNGTKVPHLMMGKIVQEAEINAIIKPTTNGKMEFILTYQENGDSGFSMTTKNVEIKSAICGNGICEKGENPTNCAVDCQVKQHTEYVSLIALTGLIIAGIGFWIWRRKNVY